MLSQGFHLFTRSFFRRHLSLLALVLLLCALSLHGDEKPRKDSPDEPSAKVLPYEAFPPAGAAVVVLSGSPGHNPLGLPLLLRATENKGCWNLSNPHGVRPLDSELLGRLRDDELLPDAADNSPAAGFERFLLHDALYKVFRCRAVEFDRVALSNLFIEDLEKKPLLHRAAVVQLHAQLRRIREIEAPRAMQQGGVPRLYEIWALVRSGGAWKQVCLLTPILPPNLKPVDDAPAGLDVSLTGYFFRRFRSGPGGGVPGHARSPVPLLIGHVAPTYGQEMRAAFGAAAMIGAGFSRCPPLEELSLLRAGEQALAWTVKDPSRVPILDRNWLSGVRDNESMPRNFMEDEKEQLETLAYYEAIDNTSKTLSGVFTESVRPEVRLVHMMGKECARYRGQVVRLEGRLRRIWRHDPVLQEAQAGVKDVYEAWMLCTSVPPGHDPVPVLLICTSLPPGIKPSEDVKGDVHVSFVGYFFKKYAYESLDTKQKVGKKKDGKKDQLRVAPLLIGHMVASKPRPKDSSTPGWTRGLVPFFFLVIVGTFVVVFLMTWGFRRADRRVLNKLPSAPPLENASPPEAPPS